MTTIGREILEPFSGVIGSSWKDISYTKTCPTQFHDAKTPRYFSHVLYACHSIHCLQLVHSLSATVGSKNSSALMVERGVLGFPKHNLAPSQNMLVGTTAFQLSTSKVADLNSHNLRQVSKSSS